jgi:hypothetical protein
MTWWSLVLGKWGGGVFLKHHFGVTGCNFVRLPSVEKGGRFPEYGQNWDFQQNARYI